MARKAKNFTIDDDKTCGYQTFTIKDDFRRLANETIILRAAINSRSKIENFSEFIRNLILEENQRLTSKLENNTRKG